MSPLTPNSQSPITTNPQSPTPNPQLYACLYRPPGREENSACSAGSALDVVAIAGEFSPRYECHGADLVSIDVSGLGRLLGPPQAIGDELRREAAARGVRAHIAVAATRMAALVLAIARPGLVVVPRGGEAAALAPISIGVLEKVVVDDDGMQNPQNAQKHGDQHNPASVAVAAFTRWGLKTLGELAALPPPDLAARMGTRALVWQAIARGDDVRPLVPTLAEERFEATLDLEWPIEELEPLSFVLTRLLEPLSTRLERRDRGAAVLHVLLRLVTRDPAGDGGREVCARRLELPTPMRDVRTLRTLALLDLEAHPPGAGIDRVTIVIDPTPGRVLQHTLFARAVPTPERLSTLVARLGALMGQDRFGAPARVDSYRPGAFAMEAFRVEHSASVSQPASVASVAQSPIPNPQSPLVSALRRCRHPVPARVAVAADRPVRVTTDRRGFAGGTVIRCAGPWRTSGDWWAGGPGGSGGSGGSKEISSVSSTHPTYLTHLTHPTVPASWDRDEWDVALSDGAVYRVFRDRATDSWYVDAIVD